MNYVNVKVTISATLTSLKVFYSYEKNARSEDFICRILCEQIKLILNDVKHVVSRAKPSDLITDDDWTKTKFTKLKCVR